jgi:hypothetical protein
MREESEMRDGFCAMRIFMLFLFCLVPLHPAEATAKQQGILWGVNESGLEFGKGPIAGTNFSVPNTNYYLSRGVQLIRVPFFIPSMGSRKIS